MTTTILRMPTGASYALNDLNQHDLEQYYMYQDGYAAPSRRCIV